MKAVFCHNRRNKRIDGIVKDQAICRNSIGFVDESVNHSEIKYCATCRQFIKISIKNNEYAQGNIAKEELDFSNKLNPKIGKTQRKFIGEGRRIWQETVAIN